MLECIYCFYLQLNIRYYLKYNCMFSILENHITTCLESWLNTSVTLMALTRRHLKVERSWGRDIPITSVVISPHMILLCVAFQMKIIWQTNVYHVFIQSYDSHMKGIISGSYDNQYVDRMKQNTFDPHMTIIWGELSVYYWVFSEELRRLQHSCRNDFLC